MKSRMQCNHLKQNQIVNKIKIVLPPRTSSLLKALALGQQEWFMQLCKGKNAVPKIKFNNYLDLSLNI